MRKLINGLVTVFAVMFMSSCVGSNGQTVPEDEPADDNKNFSTWVVLSVEHSTVPGHRLHETKFQEGDAFRLWDDHSKLLPLTKMTNRWSSWNWKPGMIHLEAISDKLYCTELTVRPGGVDDGRNWLAVVIIDDHNLTLDWLMTDEQCQEFLSHPGHARAQN